MGKYFIYGLLKNIQNNHKLGFCILVTFRKVNHFK